MSTSRFTFEQTNSPAAQPPCVDSPNLARRSLLKVGAGVAAGVAVSGLLGGQAVAANAKPAVGLQLYTLRDMMAKSVSETLNLVAGVGFNEVEFAGYFGHKASDISDMLKKAGLTAPSVHVPLDDLRHKLSQVISDAKTIGHHYIVLPWLPAEQRGSHINDYKKLAAEMTGFAKEIKAAGLQMAYHNHDFELQPVTGGLPYDVLLGDTDPDLVKMELDLYWTVKAGLDPIKLFEQHPGRFAMWHVKDMAKDSSITDVGTGTIDFKAIFAKAALAGVKHKFVEHDDSHNRIQTIRQGYQATRALLG
mgnify:CR=1 FL=1